MFSGKRESIFSASVGKRSILARSWLPSAIAVPAEFFIDEAFDSNKIEVWGRTFAHFQSPAFLHGHMADFTFTIVGGLLALRMKKGKLPFWLMPVGLFSAFSGFEISQGLAHQVGFDYGDFGAYALGSLALAGIDIAARMHTAKKDK